MGLDPLPAGSPPVWSPVEKDAEGFEYVDEDAGCRACPEGLAIQAAEMADALQMARDFPTERKAPESWPASTVQIYLALRRAGWVR